MSATNADVAIPANQVPSLYVSDLHPEVVEGTINDLFRSCGKVTSIKICRDAQTRRSLGYAYVNYETVAEAQNAFLTLNYTTIAPGGKCRIMWAQRDPSARRAGVGNLYVKNLDENIDAQQLHSLFANANAGLVTSARVARDDKGKSKGYGFVCFSTDAAADAAIAALNNAPTNSGKNLVVMKYIPVSQRGSDDWTNCFIKNIPKEWSDDKLKAVFGQFGEVASAVVARDANGVSKGFGFCSYKSHADAVTAVENLNSKAPSQFDESGKLNGTAAEENSEIPALYVGRHMKKYERQRMTGDLVATWKAQKQDAKNLFVKNFAESVTDDELRSKFATYGTITSVKVVRADNGISRGFGFVCFSNSEDAQKALSDLNHSMWHGRPLYVGVHQNKDVRAKYLEQGRNRPAARQQPAQPAPVAPMVNQQAGFPFNQAFGGNPNQMNQMFMQMMAMMMQQQQQQQQQQMMANMVPQPNQAARALAPAARVPAPQQPQVPFQATRPAVAQPAQPVAAQRPAVQGYAAAARGPVQQPVPQVARPVAGAPLQPTRPAAPATRPTVSLTPQAMAGGVPAAVAQIQQQAPVSTRPTAASNPLLERLHNAPNDQAQKNILGEHLFPQIQHMAGPLAGKITGMLIEMDTTELINLTESHEMLLNKVNEAKEVLKASNWSPNQ